MMTQALQLAKKPHVIIGLLLPFFTILLLL